MSNSKSNTNSSRNNIHWKHFLRFEGMKCLRKTFEYDNVVRNGDHMLRNLIKTSLNSHVQSSLEQKSTRNKTVYSLHSCNYNRIHCLHWLQIFHQISHGYLHIRPYKLVRVSSFWQQDLENTICLL